MVHKIIGWLFGYVTMRLRGAEWERFVNMCRHRGILLWNICWGDDRQELYASISLQNFWKLRPLARKTHVVPIVVTRHGAPFVVQKMRRRLSFFGGLVLFFGLVLFLSTRIWGITCYGQQYHTKESLLRFLEQNGVYGGVASDAISCSDLEVLIRQGYQDIGWVSVEKRGSKLFIRLQEVRLVEQDAEETAPANLVASQAGRVISIVTREGTAKVHVGDKVKKNQVLISGKVEIIGDGEEVKETKFVRASGEVVIESKKEYQDTLPMRYEKKSYTGSKKKLYEFGSQRQHLFFHNPLNRLESDTKYDIIKEYGRLCPTLSLRVPVFWGVTTYRQVSYETKKYSTKQAKKILESKYWEYLKQKEDKGYRLVKTNPEFHKLSSRFYWEDTITWQHKQTKYRNISQSTMQKEEKRDNGNHGDNH